MHLFNIAMSEAVMMQAISKIHRLNQMQIVKVYDYHVPDFFNVRQVSKTAEKTVSDFIIKLNQSIFEVNHTQKDTINLEK